MIESLRKVLVALRLTRPERDPGAPAIPYTGRTTAGVYVDADRALTNATVWACHRYLTQTVGQLPARVLRQKADSRQPGRVLSERVLNHPVEWVLAWRTNPELGPFQFKETMVGWAVHRGNGYAEIERDNAGRVVALWPLHPDRVEVVRDRETGELLYEVDNWGSGKVYLAAKAVFHLRGFGNDPVGLSVVEYAAQSIGWAAATELFSAAYFGNGMNPAGVVQSKTRLDPVAVKNAEAQLERLHKGPRRSHKWAWLPEGSEYKHISRAPNESQFIETKQHLVEEICRWYGVPPHKVMHLLRSTFNNIEHQAIEVVVDSIAPWALRFEEEANFKLFGQNRAGFYVKLDLKGLLRGDFKGRQEGLQIMRRNGVINANDWADLEDMPLPGAAGEKYIVEGNMTTLDQVGEQPEAPALPAPAPAASPEAMARIRALLTEASADVR